MVTLNVNKNIIYIDKLESPEYKGFVETYLVKYEEKLEVDPFRSNRYKKKFKSVMERRELYLEDERLVVFARGLLSVIPYEKDSNISVNYKSTDNYVITPELSPEEIRETLPMFNLRDDQVTAVNKCLRLKRGVIQLPTATGKSAIITSVIKRLHERNPDMHSLVIAPTLSTVKNITDTLTEAGLSVSTFGKPDKEITNNITTGLVQTLVSEGSDTDLSCINAVFYDECLSPQSYVLMGDGSKVKLYDIYNDKDNKYNTVLSFNTETQEYEEKKILNKFKSYYGQRFCKVYYQNPVDDEVYGVTCTDNHKFYTRDRGYVQAKDLKEGEDYIFVDIPTVRGVKFLTQKCYVPVIMFRENVGSTAKYKYNLEVEDNHNYFADNILVSNCHHLQCDTWNRLNQMLSNAEYSIGFSALAIDKEEISKTDIRDISYNASLIIGNAGRVMMHMDASYYIEKGIIAMPILIRVSNTVELPENFDESNWTRLSKTGLQADERVNKISYLSNMFYKYNRKILILVSEKNHAFKVGEALVRDGCTSFGISFGAGVGYVCNPADPNFSKKVAYKTEPSMEVVDMLANGDINVLIATQHMDEGVDVKELDVCILANGGKKDRRIIQRIGRVLRKSKTGKYAYVVDFTDDGSRVLSRQSNQRLDIYKTDIGITNILDNINYLDVEDKFKRLENL